MRRIFVSTVLRICELCSCMSLMCVWGAEQVCADDIEAVCGYERDSLDTVEGFDARVIQCLQVRAYALAECPIIVGLLAGRSWAAKPHPPHEGWNMAYTCPL